MRSGRILRTLVYLPLQTSCAKGLIALDMALKSLVIICFLSVAILISCLRLYLLPIPNANMVTPVALSLCACASTLSADLPSVMTIRTLGTPLRALRNTSFCARRRALPRYVPRRGYRILLTARATLPKSE